jgi:hypothetical protein
MRWCDSHRRIPGLLTERGVALMVHTNQVLTANLFASQKYERRQRYEFALSATVSVVSIVTNQFWTCDSKKKVKNMQNKLRAGVRCFRHNYSEWTREWVKKTKKSFGKRAMMRHHRRIPVLLTDRCVALSTLHWWSGRSHRVNHQPEDSPQREGQKVEAMCGLGIQEIFLKFSRMTKEKTMRHFAAIGSNDEKDKLSVGDITTMTTVTVTAADTVCC